MQNDKQAEYHLNDVVLFRFMGREMIGMVTGRQGTTFLIYVEDIDQVYQVSIEDITGREYPVSD